MDQLVRGDYPAVPGMWQLVSQDIETFLLQSDFLKWGLKEMSQQVYSYKKDKRLCQ